MKKAFAMLLAVLMLCLCGCGEEYTTSSRKNKDKKEPEKPEKTEEVAQMGWAVDTGSALYYWQYDEDEYAEGALLGNFSENSLATLVCRDSDGEETKLVEGTGGKFIVTGDRIYYQSGDQIHVAKLDGSDDETMMAGALVAVNETGSRVIICLDGVYQSYSVEDDEYTMLFKDCTFEGLYQDVVYYTEDVEYGDGDYEKAQKGQVTLRAINVDGTEDRVLVTTEPDLYKNPTGYAPAAIEQIRFGADGVYFSYGSIAGTGGFFQGGKIVKVSFDGSDVQVVAGQSELVDANFGIREDGSVATTDDQYFVKYEGHLNYFVLDKALYWMDPISGMSEQLIETKELKDYADSETFYVVGCEANEDSAVFMVHYCDFDPAQAVGWRDYAVRNKTVVFHLDREEMELTELYSF